MTVECIRLSSLRGQYSPVVLVLLHGENGLTGNDEIPE